VVEHVTFNHGVEGSSPSALTKHIGPSPAGEAESISLVPGLRRLDRLPDIGAVFEHTVPLPHPSGDQPQ
jgi:hypothetical protein